MEEICYTQTLVIAIFHGIIIQKIKILVFTDVETSRLYRCWLFGWFGSYRHWVDSNECKKDEYELEMILCMVYRKELSKQLHGRTEETHEDLSLEFRSYPSR
jgi:hypothetical protein